MLPQSIVYNNLLVPGGALQTNILNYLLNLNFLYFAHQVQGCEYYRINQHLYHLQAEMWSYGAQNTAFSELEAKMLTLQLHEGFIVSKGLSFAEGWGEYGWFASIRGMLGGSIAPGTQIYRIRNGNTVDCFLFWPVNGSGYLVVTERNKVVWQYTSTLPSEPQDIRVTPCWGTLVSKLHSIASLNKVGDTYTLSLDFDTDNEWEWKGWKLKAAENVTPVYDFAMDTVYGKLYWPNSDGQLEELHEQIPVLLITYTRENGERTCTINFQDSNSLDGLYIRFI